MSHNNDLDKNVAEKKDEKDSSNDKGEKLTIAKITAFQAIVVALITVFGTTVSGVTGYLIAKEKTPEANAIKTVPPDPNIKIVSKIEEGADEGFSTLRDVSVFDLRGWKKISPNETNPRVSPVNYINYLHVKKTRETKTYRAHYATTGTEIDLRCMTHQSQTLKQEKPEEHDGKKYREYEVAVNVEDIPVGKEFLIVIEATYWNSFQNLEEESVLTYTDSDIDQMEELALFVLLPEEKPIKSYNLWANPSGEEKAQFLGNSRIYKEENGRFFYWSITDRKPGYHYEITWNW